MHPHRGMTKHYLPFKAQLKSLAQKSPLFLSLPRFHPQPSPPTPPHSQALSPLHHHRTLSVSLILHFPLEDFCIINSKVHILPELVACKLFEKKFQIDSPLYSSPSIHTPNTHTHTHTIYTHKKTPSVQCL